MEREPGSAGRGEGTLRCGTPALRSLFPVLEKFVYLNSAAMAPACTPVSEAVAACVSEQGRLGTLAVERWLAVVERLRGRIASLLGCSPGEIALMKNTSEGLIRAADLIPLEEGDEILLCDMEFPANALPWLDAAERRGARVVYIASVGGRVTPKMVEEKLSRRTRILALSLVQYSNGFLADMERIGGLCEEVGAWFVVDAIQGAGVVPVDVARWKVSMLACGAHKWLLGVPGAGFLYCRADLLDRLLPWRRGWLAARAPFEFSHVFEPAEDARRFHDGSLPFAAFHGLEASLALIESLGVPEIRSHVESLVGMAIDGLRRKGYLPLTPEDPSERAGILTFRPAEGESSSLLAERLLSEGVVLSERRGALRAAFHAFNDESDVEALLQALP